MKRFLLVAALCAGLSGCGSAASPYSSPGTLYVNTKTQGVAVYQDGREIELRGKDLVRAAERAKSLQQPFNSLCDGEYAASPDGTRAVCGDPESGQLVLFDPRRPRVRRIVVRDFQDANESGIGWLDDKRFAALEADRSCPSGFHLYDYFRSRVGVFDRAGKRVASKIPCAIGLVAGRGRLALLGDAPNGLMWRMHEEIVGTLSEYDFNDGYDKYHLTWSADNGASWHDGRPLTFDGNGKLLFSTVFANDIYSEDGQTAFKDADWANWSGRPWIGKTNGM